MKKFKEYLEETSVDKNTLNIILKKIKTKKESTNSSLFPTGANRWYNHGLEEAIKIIEEFIKNEKV